MNEFLTGWKHDPCINIIKHTDSLPGGYYRITDGIQQVFASLSWGWMRVNADPEWWYAKPDTCTVKA